jgi:predicted  nucleic acid-binding Zn-ribbon protein
MLFGLAGTVSAYRAVAMNQAQQIIPQLRRLAEVERAQRQINKCSSASRTLAAEIESLRAILPTSILEHHDNRRARGKITVALVTNGICGACHLAIPRGQLAELRRVVDDLSVCGQCGAFVYLADEAQPTPDGWLKAVPGRRKKIVRAKRAPRRAKTNDSEILPAR